MNPPTLAAFLADHPLVQGCELLLPDLVGIARGKRLTLDDLEKALAGEALFATSIYALDSTGANVDRSGLVWEEGDADRPVAVDPATLAPMPWQPERAQIIGGLTEADGSPFFANPRTVLAQLQERLRALGLNPICALELEFYLLDEQLGEDGMPRLPVSERLGRRPRESEVYAHERFEEDEPLFECIESFCAAQGLPVMSALAEFAPGQFEVNLRHVPDIVTAADHAIMLKRCVKAAARRNGRRATFMAKPFEELSGSGLHMHLSLADDAGNNVFAAPGTGETMLRHAIAGLQATMGEAMLLLAPNANSYRRLQPLSYAPTAPTWGINNRTVALRVPAGTAAARRIEHRTAGADANPYLCAAAMLAGVLHGLETKGDPGPPTTGNAYAKVRGTLPTDWAHALSAFEQAEILPRYLGERFVSLYASCRRAEYHRFQARVTPIDVEWYLSSV